MDKKDKHLEIGSAKWNDDLFLKHPTPYKGIAGKVEYQRAKKIASIIKKNITKKSNILEIGCEQGNLLKYLSNKMPEANYYGTDISSIALEEASQNNKKSNIRFIQNDITNEIPSDLPTIDVLICSEVLEHIPEYRKAIQNISKLVTENTLVVITVPLEKHKNNIKSVLLKLGLFNLLFKGIEEGLSEWHVNDFSKEDITTALEKYFEIIDYQLLLLLHQIIVLKKK